MMVGGVAFSGLLLSSIEGLEDALLHVGMPGYCGSSENVAGHQVRIVLHMGDLYA
jgi:hypothetical protein